MARPRVFVSSTYYDLKYIRAGIEAFITSLGYEPVLFEKGDIPFHHDVSLEDSCLKEVGNADVLILVIGGRYGSLSKEDEEKAKKHPDEFFGRIRSVTNREYSKAIERDIPVFLFVDRSVSSEYETYKGNRQNKTVKYVHVDDVRIYELIDDILLQKRNNYLKDFTNLEDVTSWLRDQWAGIFADMLRTKNTNLQIKSLENQIRDLTDVVESLKKYNEEIIRAVSKTDSQRIIVKENRRFSAARANRLVNEPMVRFLRNDAGEKAPSPERTLQILFEAEDLATFLKLMNVEPKLMKDILDFDKAAHEFSYLRNRYIPDSPPPEGAQH